MNRKLKTCCCCWSPQTGIKILGIFSLIIHVGLMVIVTGLFITSFKQTDMEFKDCLIVVSVGWYTSFISTILLLISVFKNRHRKLLLPWLAFGLIQIIMKLCQVTLVVISPQVSLEEITTAVGLLLITTLEIYLWTVVYNYFNKLKRDAVINNILTKLQKDCSIKLLSTRKRILSPI